MSTTYRMGALFGLLALACTQPPPPSADPASLRRTPSGDAIGFVGRYGSHAWLGLPYARPPVGELRWRAPHPNDAWEGTREALTFGSHCPQHASIFGGDDSEAPGTPVGDEDCLHLDIYAPCARADAVPSGSSALPVMVWIHGGGNVVGSGRFYDGGNLASTEDVVVVAINYRLGPLGWFRHAALRRTGTAEDHSGNFGTLDIIRALEWVRDHIAAFGGDPGNVTIFGESAGGRDVFSLLVSPRARGLFHRAIVQSGGTDTLPLPEAESFVEASPAGRRNSSNEVLLRLVEGEDAPRDDALAEIAAMSPDEIERTLRGASAYELLDAYWTEDVEGLIDVPQMFRDGLVLPGENAMKLLATGGSYNGVPVVIGTTRDEYKIFLFANPDYVRRILWLVPRVRDRDSYYATARHMTDMWRATGADEPAAALTARQGGSVFVYRFDWDEAPTLLGADLSQMIGASHGFDVPFVFGHWSLGRAAKRLFTEENHAGREELARNMMAYWAEFARTGDPGTGGNAALPRWEPWGATGPRSGNFVVLDTAASGGIRMESGGRSHGEVIAAVDVDAALPSQRDKCEVYRRLATWGRGLTDEDYPDAGSRGCAEYPLESETWGG